jgi:hypothetical protein
MAIYLLVLHLCFMVRREGSGNSFPMAMVDSSNTAPSFLTTPGQIG